MAHTLTLTTPHGKVTLTIEEALTLMEQIIRALKLELTLADAHLELLRSYEPERRL